MKKLILFLLPLAMACHQHNPPADPTGLRTFPRAMYNNCLEKWAVATASNNDASCASKYGFWGTFDYEPCMMPFPTEMQLSMQGRDTVEITSPTGAFIFLDSVRAMEAYWNYIHQHQAIALKDAMAKDSLKKLIDSANRCIIGYEDRNQSTEVQRTETNSPFPTEPANGK